MCYHDNRMKVYAVTFNEYTNCLRDCVAHNERDMDFIEIPRNTPFLIFEDEIAFYQDYGGGINTLTQVGEIITKQCPFKFMGTCPMEITFPEPIKVKLINADTDKVDYCPEHSDKCTECTYAEKCNVKDSKKEDNDDKQGTDSATT